MPALTSLAVPKETISGGKDVAIRSGLKNREHGRRILAVFMVSLAFIFATLACLTTPQPPIPSLVPSTADANALEQAFLLAATQAAQTGAFSVTVTQQQLSSWLQLRAASFASQNGYEWPIKNAEAGLSDGKITLYGIYSQKNVPDTPAQIIFTPSIDANGELAMSIDSGQVGVVGIPSDTLNNLTQNIKDTLASQLAQIKGHYKLTTLTVANGTLTVAGQIIP